MEESRGILKDKGWLIGFISLNAVNIVVFTFLALVAIQLLSGVSPAAENTGTISCTSAKIPEDALGNLNKNIPIYKSAAEKTNVPWEMLASIHFREANNSPDGSLISGRTIGTPEPDQGGKVYGSLQETADDAGRILQAKEKNKLTQETTEALLVKDAFWRYNGTAYGSADNSPYVMNNFDEQHMNMPIITSDGGGIDGIDTRNGAYTTFVILKGNCS